MGGVGGGGSAIQGCRPAVMGTKIQLRVKKNADFNVGKPRAL